MKDQAQVVIIGGGIFGTSVAYHLSKNIYNMLMQRLNRKLLIFFVIMSGK